MQRWPTLYLWLVVATLVALQVIVQPAEALRCAPDCSAHARAASLHERGLASAHDGSAAASRCHDGCPLVVADDDRETRFARACACTVLAFAPTVLDAVLPAVRLTAAATLGSRSPEVVATAPIGPAGSPPKRPPRVPA